MKNKSKMIGTVLLTIILILLSINVSKAAGSFSVSAGKKSLAKGGTTTLTIKASECAGKFSISSSNANIVSVSSSSEFLDSASTSITLTAKSEGTATITVTASDVSDLSENTVSGSKSVSITVGSETTTDKGTTTPSTPTTPTEPTFKSASDTVYATGSINIRKSYSADSDAIGKLAIGESVTRTGIGDNGWSKVTYNGVTGYIKTSLLSTEEPTKSSDKTLKTLEIKQEGLDPEFNPETTTYSLIVGADVEKLDITATPNDEKAKVEISGNDALQIGDNMIKITVIAQDETTRVYNINVKKQEQTSLGLSTLKVTGYSITPVFSSSEYSYSLNVLDPNVSKLDISAVANDEEAKVDITGNTDLKDGNNIVTITVTSKDGNEKVTYQIKVNKIATAAGTTNKNMILYGGIGAGVLILIIIIIVVIVKNKKKNKKDEDLEDYSDLYGYSNKDVKSKNNSDVPNIDKLNNFDVDGLSQNNKNEFVDKELFGTMPNEKEDFNNVQLNNQNTQDTPKNEDKFQYNPYSSKDLYADFEDKPELNSFNTNIKAEESNEISNDDFDERRQNQDYAEDNGYKSRRSKGKHSV